MGMANFIFQMHRLLLCTGHWYCFSFIADTNLFLQKYHTTEITLHRARNYFALYPWGKSDKHEAHRSSPSTSEIKNT
jgi:hypothetical protein